MLRLIRSSSVMKNLVAFILFVLTFMVAVVLSAQQPQSLTELYVFGDSLSDSGTVFQATGGLYPSDPPYFQGRYSNGKVWVEYLADRLSVHEINNFASGGATTVDSGSLVPGLLSQVQFMRQRHPQADDDALYILWAGANDYLQGTSDSTIPVANITRAIARLADTGAQHVLVANLPDLGQLPATRNSGDSTRLTRLTEAHNTGLRRSLKQLNQQHPELNIITLDVSSLYRGAISNPAQFGFTQVTSACLSGSTVCRNPEQFLFWDSIHPTTTAHQILANAAMAALETQLPLASL
jgi:thermolabile hemolysin